VYGITSYAWVFFLTFSTCFLYELYPGGMFYRALESVAYEWSGFFAHLFLPTLLLGMGFSITMTRLIRNNLLQVLGSDYILAAKAKGLRYWWAILKHTFPNAFISVLTLAGLYLGCVFGGAPIVETLFAWPGLG